MSVAANRAARRRSRSRSASFRVDVLGDGGGARRVGRAARVVEAAGRDQAVRRVVPAVARVQVGRTAWSGKAAASTNAAGEQRLSRFYVRGAMLHLTNPKAILVWVSIVALSSNGAGVARRRRAGLHRDRVPVFGGYALVFSMDGARRLRARPARDGSVSCRRVRRGGDQAAGVERLTRQARASSSGGWRVAWANARRRPAAPPGV